LKRRAASFTNSFSGKPFYRGGLYVQYHDKADIRWAAPPHSAQRYAEVSFAQLDSSAAGSACTLRVRDPSKEKPIRFVLMSVFVRKKRRVIVLQKADISDKILKENEATHCLPLEGKVGAERSDEVVIRSDECSVL